MDYFKNIKLNLKEYPEQLGNLSKINIFVGANNSGKSRLLRQIFCRNIKFNNIQSLEIYKLYKGAAEDLNKKYEGLEQLKDRTSLNISANYKQLEFVKDLSDCKNYHDNIKKNITQNTSGTSIIYDGRIKSSDLARDIDKQIKTKEELFRDLDKKYIFVYIPMLRGLRPIDRVDYKEEYDKDKQKILENYKFGDWDSYRARTIFDYFKKTTSNNTEWINFNGDYPNCNIFTGLTLYNDIKKMLLGSKDNRALIKEYEEFLSENFFNNQDIELIPRLDYDVLNIKIAEEEHPIYSLGDGLQTVLICTFPLFQYKKENVVLCIEEPELTLHPSMQRKLLETFSNDKYSKNTQIFITTHSNHLLDITLDYSNISIYSFEKTEDEKFTIKNNTQNKEILDLLGIRNSSVFLSNCIIWVEGISDRLYIKKYLQLYQDTLDSKNRFEEDKHYSILEYSGGNITHFNFFNQDVLDKIDVSAINKNNFLIADNDGYDPRTGKEYLNVKHTIKGERLQQLYNQLPNNFWAYHKEIEYLLPLIILNEVKTTKYVADDFGHNLILDNTNFEEYDEKLKYIKNIKQEIGISDKREYAEKMIKEIGNQNITFNQLPNITKEFVKKIYNFIQENNK
jgi:predicted ATP-dependent endonuclease of OLD family